MNTPLPRAWLPAILWMAVIALESSSVGSAENTGRFLLAALTFIFGKINPVTFLHIHGVLRKAGHFFGYAVLCLTMYRGWWATLALRDSENSGSLWRDMFRRWSAPAAVLALLCTALVAGLDEWHQAYLPGRGSSVADVALDCIAGVFTQMLLIAVSNLRTVRGKSPLAVGR